MRLKSNHFAPMLLACYPSLSANLKGKGLDLPVLLILLLALGSLCALLAPTWWRRRQMRLASAEVFPRAQRQWLRQHWPLYRKLPSDVQLRLHKSIQQFLADKEFVGCDGFVVTPQVQLLIAAQACLLSINQPESHYPELRQILVYPDAFVVPTKHIGASGVVTEHSEVRLGESWTQGQVILSWRHTQAGAAAPYDGQNLVFHEFAHQLDQLSGQANGAPPQPTLALQQRWAQQMPTLYANYCADLAQRKPRLLDAYASTNAAEFFAVAVECFFERPAELQLDSPSLYLLLRDYFQLDPQLWNLSH